MLYKPIDAAGRFGDWREGLAPAVVALVAFPAPSDQENGPRPRPCLVIDLVDFGGDRFALLANGMGGRHGARDRLDVDVDVTEPDEIAAAGCRRPWRFAGAQRLLISVETARFVATASTGPLLGRLTGAALRRFHIVRRGIAHETAAARAHQERRRSARIAGHDFVVEHRRPRRIRKKP